MALQVIQGGNADSGLKREVFDAFKRSCGLKPRFVDGKGVRFFDKDGRRFSEEVLKGSVRFLAFADGFASAARNPRKVIENPRLMAKAVEEIMRQETEGRLGFSVAGGVTNGLVERVEQYYQDYYREGAAARFDTLKK